MGRKAEYHLKPKKGPGKKAKKQQAPVFNFKDDGPKKLSRHQTVRAKKRALKTTGKEEKEIGIKPAKNRRWEPEANDEDSGSDGQELDSPFMSEEEEEEAEEGLESFEKPKEMLFGDSDDDEEEEDDLGDSDMEGDDFGDDDDDDDEDDIEKLSKKLERRKKADAAEADAYMDEAAAKVAVEIPTLEEVVKELDEAPDLPTIQCRIKDVAFVLSDVKSRREEGRSRSEYMAIFLKDLCKYYSYNEYLMKKIMELFSVTELVEFLEANERPRPITIRTNTLKTRRKLLATSLIDQGVDVDVITWSKVGLVAMQTPGTVAIGATPQYLAGHYILQGASSFLPVMALSPKCDEKILDMCAAPGGKSTHIASIMRNTGMLVSNDVNPARVKALVGNFHRMGINNTVISSVDGRTFAKTMANAFDRILLDAPCSGTGVISKDERVKTSKDGNDIHRCTHLQKELLLAAIDAVHKFNGKNGYVVYSTCSVLVEENEEVIQYALKKRHVRLVPTGLDVGKPGFARFRGRMFHPSMDLCKRVYPHSYNMDGFFVAKLLKIGDQVKNEADNETEEGEEINEEAANGEAEQEDGKIKGKKRGVNGNAVNKKVVHSKGKNVVINGKGMNNKGKSFKDRRNANNTENKNQWNKLNKTGKGPQNRGQRRPKPGNENKKMSGEKPGQSPPQNRQNDKKNMNKTRKHNKKDGKFKKKSQFNKKSAGNKERKFGNKKGKMDNKRSNSSKTTPKKTSET